MAVDNLVNNFIDIEHGNNLLSFPFIDENANGTIDFFIKLFNDTYEYYYIDNDYTTDPDFMDWGSSWLDGTGCVAAIFNDNVICSNYTSIEDCNSQGDNCNWNSVGTNMLFGTNGAGDYNVIFILGQGVGLFRSASQTNGWSGNLNNLSPQAGYWVNIVLDYIDDRFPDGFVYKTNNEYQYIPCESYTDISFGNNLLSYNWEDGADTMDALGGVNFATENFNFIVGQGVGLFKTPDGWSGNLNTLKTGKGYWLNIVNGSLDFKWGFDGCDSYAETICSDETACNFDEGGECIFPAFECDNQYNSIHFSDSNFCFNSSSDDVCSGNQGVQGSTADACCNTPSIADNGVGVGLTAVENDNCESYSLNDAGTFSVYDCVLFVCNETECPSTDITGCMDDTACNYDSNANSPGYCEYPLDGYNCAGECVIGEDCNGECGGTVEYDDCGVCGGTYPGNYLCNCTGLDGEDRIVCPPNECPGDSDGDGICNDVDDCGLDSGGDGTGLYDECGVCNGGNADKDCLGECFGDAVLDECGVCDGGNVNMDCAGVCFGNNVGQVCGCGEIGTLGYSVTCWDDSLVCIESECPPEITDSGNCLCSYNETLGRCQVFENSCNSHFNPYCSHDDVRCSCECINELIEIVECEVDRDCGIGYICIHNICVLDTNIIGQGDLGSYCRGDIECNRPYICSRGQCSEPECRFNNDCVGDEICLNGRCMSQISIGGCMDINACNYDENATEPDSTCCYVMNENGNCADDTIYCDCFGTQYDCAGICGGNNIEDDFTYYGLDGCCLESEMLTYYFDQDCDGEGQEGQPAQACYKGLSFQYEVSGFIFCQTLNNSEECDGGFVDACGDCWFEDDGYNVNNPPNECFGCMYSNAINYDNTATIDDGNCEFVSLSEYSSIENAGGYVLNTVGFPFPFDITGLENISILLNQSIYLTDPDVDENAHNMTIDSNIFDNWNALTQGFQGIQQNIVYFGGGSWEDFGQGFTIKSQTGLYFNNSTTFYIKWNLDGFDNSGNYTEGII